MRGSKSSVGARLRNLWRSDRGFAAVILAILMPVIVGFSGLAIDVGHTLVVKSSLQASTNAAALAGAKYLTGSNASAALAAATTYSAVAGNKNTIPGVNVTMATGYPKLMCLTSTGVACSGGTSANAIKVQQQASVPMWFAQVIGISSVPVTATALAGASGGATAPLNVMLVVDTTGSMNSPDSSCSVSGATRISCGLTGGRTLLQIMNPAIDSVGIMVFPGLKNSSQAVYDYDCSSGTNPAIVSYAASPVYQVLGLQTDYKTSSGATSLNSASYLVSALGGGGSKCAGLAAIGGYGTYYADAITAAQSALVANGQKNAQNVIIFLSDGDASASTSNVPSGKSKNQCAQGVSAAAAATAAGTWVYTIAYGASTSASGSCSTDSPAISACSAMQQMASQPQFFYSDTTGGTSSCTSSANSVSELVSIFQSVGSSFSIPRLLPITTS